MQRYKLWAIFTLFFSFSLSISCSSVRNAVDMDCPHIKIEKDTAKASYFINNSKNPLDEVFSAEIKGYEGSCTFDKEKSTVNLDLSIEFGAEIGPAAESLTQKTAYFVAIPEFYPLASAKQVFPVAIKFAQGHDHIEYTERGIIVSIPVAKDKKASHYTVYIGMQLDKTQLEYNRDNRTIKDLK